MTSVTSEVEGIILSASASFILLWIAYKKDAFRSWQNSAKLLYPPTFLLLFIAFIIYFGSSLILPPFLNHLLNGTIINDRVVLATWITFLTEGTTLFLLITLCQVIFRPIFYTIWKNNPHTAFQKDLVVALTACLISFPVVMFVGQFLELAVYFIFHTFEIPDQNVILFLKLTFGKPLFFFLATISIIIFAPLVEELLFRGFLQTYLRRYFNPIITILLTSACFALFHYSTDQGVGNIPIIGSLFVLSNFLGFVYEKQGSLLCPMILHSLFNALNIINLYLAPQ